jgi:hypothetical protein
MRYRVETVKIPGHGGITGPGSESLDLPGRRIVHVIDVRPDDGGVRARVLTEEAPVGTTAFFRNDPDQAEHADALG